MQRAGVLLDLFDRTLELPFKSKIVTQPYVDFLAHQYKLSHNGHHGIEHWLRVLINGRLIAKKTGADVEVIEHFALLHDVMRENEQLDPPYGQRASEFAAHLWGDWVHHSERQMQLLREACRSHCVGRLSSDATIQACWDADRLDLARVGVRPNPTYLGHKVSRDPEFIKRAVKRSRQRFVNYTFGV